MIPSNATLLAAAQRVYPTHTNTVEVYAVPTPAGTARVAVEKHSNDTLCKRPGNCRRAHSTHLGAPCRNGDNCGAPGHGERACCAHHRVRIVNGQVERGTDTPGCKAHRPEPGDAIEVLSDRAELDAAALVSQLEALAIAGVRTYSVGHGREYVRDAAGELVLVDEQPIETGRYATTVYPWDAAQAAGEYHHLALAALDAERVRTAVTAFLAGGGA